MSSCRRIIFLLLCSCIIFFSIFCYFFFFFKQKTAYEMRISDWSSDVCSSDLGSRPVGHVDVHVGLLEARRLDAELGGATADVAVEIGRASCRERVCQYV